MPKSFVSVQDHHPARPCGAVTGRPPRPDGCSGDVVVRVLGSRKPSGADYHRTGICTLYAPCATSRRAGRAGRAPVKNCQVRGKAGAGERTRTADLLITNQTAGNPTEPKRTDHRTPGRTTPATTRRRTSSTEPSTLQSGPMVERCSMRTSCPIFVPSCSSRPRMARSLMSTCLRHQDLAVDVEGVLDSRVTTVLREPATSLGRPTLHPAELP